MALKIPGEILAMKRRFLSYNCGTVLYSEASILLEALPNSVNPKLPISVKTHILSHFCGQKGLPELVCPALQSQ